MAEKGNTIFTPDSNLKADKETSIHDFMDQFKPLMEKLKDK